LTLISARLRPPHILLHYFSFHHTAPTDIYTLSLHDALPIYHGTFIIAFSKSKQHFSVAPEAKAIAKFTKQIDASAYSQTNNLFRIKWSQDVDYSLLKSIIQFNIEDKADCTTFWRS